MKENNFDASGGVPGTSEIVPVASNSYCTCMFMLFMNHNSSVKHVTFMLVKN